MKSFNSTFPSISAHKESCQLIQILGQERGIIKLQLYWGEFCHELVIKSAIGRYQTLTGSILLPATMSSLSTINKEANKLSGRRYFPWHMPEYCTVLAKNIGTSNYNQIRAGLSIIAPVADLIAIRNYVVHPSKQNQIRYRRVAIKYGQPKATPIKLLSTRLPSGSTLFESWVGSLRLMAELAIR